MTSDFICSFECLLLHFKHYFHTIKFGFEWFKACLRVIYNPRKVILTISRSKYQVMANYLGFTPKFYRSELSRDIDQGAHKAWTLTNILQKSFSNIS